MSVPGSPAQIWIVDDSADVRFFFERAFKRVGKAANVSFFGDGEEVIRHVRAGHSLPKLIVLDMEMPRMDGIATLKTLRTEQSGAGTAVLICSSVEEPRAVSEAYSVGAKLYVRKPFSNDEYLQLAALCLESADDLGKLPSPDLPFGVVDVKRAVQLIEAWKASSDSRNLLGEKLR